MADDFGFRIVGSCTTERRLVCWPTAFVAYATLDERAEVEREAYLSEFTFGEDFRRHLDTTGTTKGFGGECGGPFIWFDIDREGDIEAARRETARLSLSILERYQALDEDDLLVLFSGSKGFHVGLPTDLWRPSASLVFNTVAKRLAERLAGAVQVVIDLGTYDKVRAFRAPNSRHPKTGLHKRRVTMAELTRLSVERIQELAREPLAFDMPMISTQCNQAAADWQDAIRRVEQDINVNRQRQTSANGSARLNRSTLDFIKNGAEAGDRHRLLFSAASNLAEFQCPSELAHELLTEAALDSGLSPSDVRRQINCGLNHNAAVRSSPNSCNAISKANHQPTPTPASGTLFDAEVQGKGYYDR